MGGNRTQYKLLFFIICMMLIAFMSPTFVSHAESYDVLRPKIVFGDDLNYPPYAFLDKNGNPTGFSVELAIAVGNAMGYDVEIKLDEWSKTRVALENGDIDAISGMFYSKERESLYNFTTKHSVTNGEIFTNSNIKIDTLEDLRNKTIVVQRGDIVGEYLQSLNLNIVLIEVGTIQEALSLIENGTYDYSGLLQLPGLYEIEHNKFKKIISQNLNLIPNDYCMAVRKDNEDLALLLNGGLKIVKATGEYQAIYDKWLGVYEEKNIPDLIREYRWFLGFIAILVLVLVVFNYTLRNAVKKRTHELQSMNEQLIENFEEIFAMKENLILSESRSRAILSALPDIVFTVSSDGYFLDCHVGQFEDLISPPELFLGKHISEFLPKKIAEDCLEMIKKAIETKTLQNYEYELQQDGNRNIFEMRIVHVYEDKVICITRNVSADRINLERIEYLSYHDQMTGLYNRRYFEEELIKLDTSRNLPLSVILADVNGLKLVNDSFGHMTGDELIIKAAEILKFNCRSNEVISRVGGDEFVILIPKMDSDGIIRLLNRIQEHFKTEHIGFIEVSLSFGWAVKSSPTEDLHEIVNRADDHMYKNKIIESAKMRKNTINAIMRTLFTRDAHEAAHSENISNYLRKFCRFLDYSNEEIETFALLGQIHDIGKIGIQTEYLTRPGLLSNQEMNEVKKHSDIGYRILNTVNDMTEISNYVLYHHERWDGHGYPAGLAGKEIPIYSRILMIADAYDAMIHERPYHMHKTELEAMSEIKRVSGTQFDPELAEKWIQCFMTDLTTK